MLCRYSEMELGTSVQGDLASPKPLPATDILGMISTQIKLKKPPNNYHGECKQGIPPKPPWVYAFGSKECRVI